VPDSMCMNIIYYSFNYHGIDEECDIIYDKCWHHTKLICKTSAGNLFMNVQVSIVAVIYALLHYVSHCMSKWRMCICICKAASRDRTLVRV
jgi:hypothetical protein